MNVDIIGWGHTRFGKSRSSLEELIVEAATAALVHAQLPAEEIDEIVLGHFNAGFSTQDFTAALVLQADPALRFRPATRVENACASGSAAVHAGIRAIKSGEARKVLVVGAERMSDTPGPEVGRNLLRAAYLKEEGETEGGFAGLFGQVALAYFKRHGDKSDALAAIAAKNHRNGAGNPLAHLQKDLGLEFCRTTSPDNPLVAGPLRRTDCSPVSDGAAALVLSLDTAHDGQRAVKIAATAHAQEFMPAARRDPLLMEGCREAWGRALSRADWRIDDLSFVETHDCFTIAELLQYEAMGLAPYGRGADVVASGLTEADGRLPINRSGGLKAKGHPIGATGVSMHVMAAMQLTGEAPSAMQLQRADRAGIFNMGGLAVANYVSLLEAR
ncbi:acetyl-CoA C-acetyltransferase [Aminobacter aminovorans]|uniref:Beta-ketoadipyl-CoA thiolase n=1 Tax=Aminobacter aminovorans TaxID=83263 RepID=A0A381IKN6_AMIAI|nr:acetyl-CoA acetyltransferase [Aminobacter aminovorans]TCS25049.1 acetyl-CoA C-acetyltransferase [Aminobacter aminovorans]SUY28475.1 Beta-ketoadipyl-CoA thiolase [Aminobacter aminovorans]